MSAQATHPLPLQCSVLSENLQMSQRRLASVDDRKHEQLSVDHVLAVVWW